VQYLDIEALAGGIFRNASALGITELRTPCYRPPAPGSGGNGSVCADPSAHLLWDQVLFCASHVGYRDVGTPKPSACRATCRRRRWKAAAMASSCRKPARTCWGTMRIVAPRCGECGGVFSEFGDLRQCCHGDQSACWRRQAHGSSGGSRQPPAAVAACPYCVIMLPSVSSNKPAFQCHVHRFQALSCMQFHPTARVHQLLGAAVTAATAQRLFA